MLAKAAADNNNVSEDCVNSTKSIAVKVKLLDHCEQIIQAKMVTLIHYFYVHLHVNEEIIVSRYSVSPLTIWLSSIQGAVI